jgi:hypothetical protein
LSFALINLTKLRHPSMVAINDNDNLHLGLFDKRSDPTSTNGKFIMVLTQ